MTDPEAGLQRRVEEASLNAWPAMHQVLLDGWLLRFSSGFTRRANSITPLYPSMQPAAEKLRYCENLYAREKLQTIFRLTSIDDHAELDAALGARGYDREDLTWVLHTTLAADPTQADAGFQALTLLDWLSAYCLLAGMPDNAARLHSILLKSIRADAIFGVLCDDGEIVACGLAVVEHDLAGLFDIVTHPERRRRGYGIRLVNALLSRSAARGAHGVYLQVMDDNIGARDLYQKLGFEPLYQYWYRTQAQR